MPSELAACTVSPLSRRSFVSRSAAGAIVALTGRWSDSPPAIGASPAAPRATSLASPLPDAPWDDATYWEFADRVQARLDEVWSEERGVYEPGGGGETTCNACLLLTHAVAAVAGHRGACRQDERARRLAHRLCQAPPFRLALADAPSGSGLGPDAGSVDRVGGDPTVASPLADEDALQDPQPHAWGWGGRLNSFAGQHAMVDAQVVRALTHAWLARDVLSLDATTVELIVDRVARCASSEFHAYPALRLNQINWPIEIYTCGALVTGDERIVQRDGYLQYRRFADAMTQIVDGFKSPVLGPGYRFHYLTQHPEDHPTNLDSAEYATMVCGALEHYERAVAAGMAPLDAASETRLRAWVDRVLCGYWTHAGYLNWDTGLAFARWHSGKKVGLSQDALFAILAAPRFQPDPDYGRWAKWMLDRGLRFYDQLATVAGGLAPAVPFGVTHTKGSVGDARLWAVRMQANAARAVMKKLSAHPAAAPPALYAYDPDIGRLAVTTPAYNTAVIAVSQRRLPYGGVELARFYDGDQRVAAGIGGRPPASFGVVVHDHGSRRELASQRGRPAPDLLSPPLRLARAPFGAEPHPAAYPPHAYAGRFDEIEAVGLTTSADVTIETAHRFQAEWVETTWTIEGRGASGPYSVLVLFPSWGRTAAIWARTHDANDVPVTDSPLSLDRVAWFHVHGEETGYVVVPAPALPPGTARVQPTQPQSSAPRCGPTLTLEVLTKTALRRLQLAVRLAPAENANAAVEIATQLQASP